MRDFALGQVGLELDAPSAGDIVTVKLKPCPRRNMMAEVFLQPHLKVRDLVEDESKNPQHYRHTAIWRVIAANGGQAVVEQVTDGYGKGRREVWAIDAHRWFEASELLAALEEDKNA
jgi:tRNA G37 N-methylase Trm5